MAITAQLADGRTLEFPDGTDPGVIQSTVKRLIAESQPKGAGFSLGDIASSFMQGAYGSTQALTDVFGAGNIASSKLEELAKASQAGMTPARQAELAKQQERVKQAEASGSTWEEIKAAAQNVAEAPLQSAAQALGSFVPYIPTMFAGPAAAGLGLGARATAAATAVSRIAPEVIGTAQGAGAVKSAIYDAVYDAEIKDGKSPQEAQAKATAAQEYAGKNIDQIATGAGLGFLAGRFGAERLMSPEAAAAASKSVAGRVGTAIAADVPTEAMQGGQERLAANLALQREGRDVPTWQGVASQAAQEGLLGLLGAGPVAAVRGPDIEALREQEAQKRAQEFEAEKAKAMAEMAVRPKEPEVAERLPGGFEIQREEVGRETVPESFGVFAEGDDKPLTTVPTQEEAQAKVESFKQIREKERENYLTQIENLNDEVTKRRERIDYLEAMGQTGTEEYQQAKAILPQQEEAAETKARQLAEQMEQLGKPLTITPIGQKETVQERFNVISPTGKLFETHATQGEAEASVRKLLGEEVFKQHEAQIAAAQEKKARDERIVQLEKDLVPALQKFGLKDVGLKVVDQIENNAGGSYLNKLIRVAYDEANPMQTMRHESVHALKDLGFFSPQQWKALEERAKKEWIGKHLEGQTTEIDGQQMSRLEGYRKLGYSEDAIIEEAIADAFAAYDKGEVPPPGLIASLFKKLKNFFTNLGQALRGAGFESADDIFQRIERGELKAGKPAEPTGEIKYAAEKAKQEEEKLSLKKPASDIGHKREATSGRYVGAPDWVGNSPQQLTALRKKLKALAKEGEPGRYWYENSSKAILELADGDKKEAEKIVSLIAIYSPNATVPANTSMALNAYYQFKTGQPIKAGTTDNNRKAAELLEQNKEWSGIKTNSFYQNLMVEIDPSKLDPGVATMDMWMAIAFDYGMKSLDQGPKYKFTEREIQRLAEELGWKAHQVQAAIWTAMKGRVDPIRDALKEKELKLGIGEMVEKDGKQVYRVKPDRRYDHFRLAHKMGMDRIVQQSDIEESKYDFSDAIRERSVQMSWEATPGATTGILPGIFKAPISQKFEYLQAVAKELKDENGQDIIAKAVGMPGGKTIFGFSAWQGDIGAGAQTYTGVALQGSNDQRNLTQQSRDILNLYAAIKGYVLSQEAVVYHVPDYNGSVKRQNGIETKFNRALNEEEMSELYRGLHEKFGTWEIAPGYTPDGARLLNFVEKSGNDGEQTIEGIPFKGKVELVIRDKDWNEKPVYAFKAKDGVVTTKQPVPKGSYLVAKLSNKAFHEGVESVLSSLPKSFGDGMIDFTSYRSIGDYISNDWTEAKNGEQYLEKIASAQATLSGPQRPNLQEWATDVRSRIEAVNERFSKKYGWGKAGLAGTGPSELAGRSSDSGGIVLGKSKQEGAVSYTGIHYGKEKVDILLADKYGTGIRGAERRRLDDAMDPRIKRRVYFYIPKTDGKMSAPEAGLGANVYRQQFANILGPGKEFNKLYAKANGDPNEFETQIIDAGYDGYAAPSLGMMVILNHNVPVTSLGTRAELQAKGEKYSLKQVRFPSVAEVKKAVAEAEVPDTKDFKMFIGASKWLDKDKKPMFFYHSTARDFFAFTPAGQSNAIFLATSPEEAETFGNIAEDRLRREIYKALNKSEKLELLQRVVDAEVKSGNITAKAGTDFMKQADRKAPEYGDFGDIEQQVYDALLDLSPTRMSIMPVYARAETPFDFENPDHVNQVMHWVMNNTQVPQDFPEKWAAGMKGRIAQGLWQAIEDKRVQQAIRALGFDAFTVRENRASPKNYAVYNPRQLKSITGNDGSFSLETKDIRFSLRHVGYTPKRVTQLLHTYAYTQNDNDTKAYVARVSPRDFLNATATSDGLQRIREEMTSLDVNRLIEETQPIYLQVREGQYLQSPVWEIRGHEGRHRMMALADAGYDSVPVVFDFGNRIKDAKEVKRKYIIRQSFGDAGKAIQDFMIEDAVPISYGSEARLREFEKAEGIKFSLPKMPNALDDRVGETTTRRDPDNFALRMTKAISPENWGYFRQKAINRYNQLGVYDRKLVEQMGGKELLADQSAESAALMSDLGAGIAASAMGMGDRHGGIPVYRNGITTIDRSVKGLVAALGPLAKYNDPKIYQYYQYWAMVKRGVRLNMQGKETGVDNTDVQYAKYLQEKFPEFVQVQKDFIAFNNGLVKYARDTGVISEQNAQEFMKYADYVPFYRQMDGETTVGPNIFQSIAGIKPPKKLKGGTAPLADFLETAVRNTQSMIQAGVKNSAAQRAVDVVTKVKAPGMGAERLDHDATGPDVFQVLENGKRVSYRTPDHLLLDAISSLHMPELPFMGILSAPANALRNLVTKDPGFMMANLMRDSLSAWVTSGQNVTPISGTVINFGKVLARKSPGYEALIDSGVIGGYELSHNIERSGRELEKDLSKKAGKKAPLPLRPFTSLWDALERGTEASDAATRALVYENVMKETGNEAEALFRAMEVMNFNRKGNSPLIRVVTAAVPFLNARIQGLDLFFRASTGNMNMADRKAIQRKFWVRGATMMAISAMYYMMVHDDDEYKAQEQETKDNNWLLTSLGIRIPIPFEVGVLFKVMPERITAYVMGNDTGQDMMDSMKRNFISTFAFNPIPQTVKPIVEATTNFNFFTWRPIVGQGMQDVAAEYQVGPGTSKIAKSIGETLGLSPLKVDHIIKGYTGTMGMYAIDVMDSLLDQFGDSPKAAKRFEQMPIIKRFAIDPAARGSVTAYYELKDTVDTTVRTMNLLERSMEPDKFAKYVQENIGPLAVKDYVRDLEKSMKDIREMRQGIQVSSMSAEEKRDALLALTQAENNLTKNIQDVKKSIASLK